MPINDSNEVYFAAKPGKELASTLLHKSKSFFDILETNAYLEKITKMWRAYHGAYNTNVADGHQITFVGEQGELVSLPVNHFHNIAAHMHTMITSVRPIMDARAINTDLKSQSQAYLANGILEYYMREKGLEDALKLCAQMAIILSAGFILMEWDATAGELYDYDENNKPIFQGDIKFTNLSPYDVVFDGTKENWNHDWILVKLYKNRFDLMAKYPEYTEQLKGIETKSQAMRYRYNLWTNDETDDIVVYVFFHRKTESMPEGRYCMFVSDDIILLDTNMPYRTLPVYRMAPDNIMGTPYGYTPMFDVFPLQEALNGLDSAIMTNNNANATQSIWVPRGSDITPASITGGMNVIESDVKPEPIQLTQSAPETFEYRKILISDMETLSGINSVARGNPEASLKSGTALALVQSMALQFINGIQQSYVKLIENIGTGLIENLKDFAHTPRIVAITGKTNRPLLKEFTSDDISSIKRVIVDVGNPLARTLAGRTQMAETLAQMKLLDNAEQYFQIINTGKLEVVYEGEMSQLLLIKDENEKLMAGERPIVSPLDEHRTHVKEHSSVLSNTDVRYNPTYVKNVMDHIEEHARMLRETDPEILALVGQEPLPSNVGLHPPMPPQQNPNGGASGPLSGPIMPTSAIPPEQNIQNVANDVNLPQPAKPPAPFENLPTNPADLLPK